MLRHKSGYMGNSALLEQPTLLLWRTLPVVLTLVLRIRALKVGSERQGPTNIPLPKTITYLIAYNATPAAHRIHLHLKVVMLDND